MSHFTVLVIGENPEEQLKPFDENLKVEYKDKTEEYREEYEAKMVDEFYCASSSSWGFRITQELFETLQKSKIGRVLIYDNPKLDPMSYLKTGGKYRGYYELPGGKRCKGTMWFEVEQIIETTHPNPDTCFQGKVRIRKIGKPKKIALKDKYPDYEEYLRDWHGVEDEDRQGYDFNPNAKWDWYQLGGRWTGYFKLKSGKHGELGDFSLVSSRRAEYGTADQAYKRDIDFERMEQDQFEETSATYDKFEAGYKAGTLKPGDAYWEYGVENTGEDAEHYVPETREQYLKRCAPVRTFAVLKDGVWIEKGEMGWFGITSNEKDPDDWNDEYKKLIDSLPDNTLLSVFDCHI
jgi:hypothetical protein